jgi:hypothetical protein
LVFDNEFGKKPSCANPWIALAEEGRKPAIVEKAYKNPATIRMYGSTAGIAYTTTILGSGRSMLAVAFHGAIPARYIL